MEISVPSTKGIFEAFRTFARPRERREACNLCGAGIAPSHPHLLELTNQEIVCACDACATLFSHRGDGRKLIRIPRDARKLASFQLTDAQWAGLRLPIDLAFFVHRMAAQRVVAFYPSPAGNTESHLSLEAWEEIERANPVLAAMEQGAEALLVDRTRENRRYFIAPIDQCYRLTGLIRTNWRGFSGGEAVWQRVDEFFSSLEETARA